MIMLYQVLANFLPRCSSVSTRSLPRSCRCPVTGQFLLPADQRPVGLSSFGEMTDRSLTTTSSPSAIPVLLNSFWPLTLSLLATSNSSTSSSSSFLVTLSSWQPSTSFFLPLSCSSVMKNTTPSSSSFLSSPEFSPASEAWPRLSY